MKIMIASDIHGSALWCSKLLELYRNEKAEKLLLLGDILYHGPRNDLPDGYAPKEVMAMLNGMKEEIICVRGNCDAEVDLMVLEFALSEEILMLDFDSKQVFAAHGHKHNPETMPFLSDEDVLLCGHTHIPQNETISNVLCLNPGSVSIPKNGSAHSCMMYENGVFSWINLANDTVYMERK